MKHSELAKTLISHTAAGVCAYVAHVGTTKIAQEVGGAFGRLLAPTLNPLLTSPSSGRRATGFVLLLGACVPLGVGVGGASAAVVTTTFIGVEHAVSTVLADEDWSAVDKIGDKIGETVAGPVADGVRSFGLRMMALGLIPAIQFAFRPMPRG